MCSLNQKRSLNVSVLYLAALQSQHCYENRFHLSKFMKIINLNKKKINKVALFHRENEKEWKEIDNIPITIVMQVSAVWKFFVRHKMRRATFSLRKQQLCTIFRTLVTGQSRAIKWSVIYLPRNVHGGTANHGTMFTIQPCESNRKKYFF